MRGWSMTGKALRSRGCDPPAHSGPPHGQANPCIVKSNRFRMAVSVRTRCDPVRLSETERYRLLHKIDISLCTADAYAVIGEARI